MEKKNYLAPEIEEMEMEVEDAIVAISTEEGPEYGGDADPSVVIPD